MDVHVRRGKMNISSGTNKKEILHEASGRFRALISDSVHIPFRNTFGSWNAFTSTRYESIISQESTPRFHNYFLDYIA